jgi:hypothetical protein
MIRMPMAVRAWSEADCPFSQREGDERDRREIEAPEDSEGEREKEQRKEHHGERHVRRGARPNRWL